MNKLNRYESIGLLIITFLLISFQSHPSGSSLVNIIKSILLVVISLLLIVSILTKSTKNED